MKPDVMECLPVGSRHAHPQHHSADTIGKCGAAVLGRAVLDVTRQHRLDLDVTRRRLKSQLVLELDPMAFGRKDRPDQATTFVLAECKAPARAEAKEQRQ